MVYIEEAHAQDEWPIGSAWREQQARTLEERATAAQRVVDELKLSTDVELVLDSFDPVDTTFNERYKAWPFRYYVFDRHGMLQLVSQPVGAALPFSELPSLLERLVAEKL